MGDETSGPGNNSNDMASGGANIVRSDFVGVAPSAPTPGLQRRRPELPHLRPRSHPHLRGRL